MEQKSCDRLVTNTFSLGVLFLCSTSFIRDGLRQVHGYSLQLAQPIPKISQYDVNGDVGYKFRYGWGHKKRARKNNLQRIIVLRNDLGNGDYFQTSFDAFSQRDLGFSKNEAVDNTFRKMSNNGQMNGKNINMFDQTNSGDKTMEGFEGSRNSTDFGSLVNGMKKNDCNGSVRNGQVNGYKNPEFHSSDTNSYVHQYPNLTRNGDSMNVDRNGYKNGVINPISSNSNSRIEIDDEKCHPTAPEVNKWTNLMADIERNSLRGNHSLAVQAELDLLLERLRDMSVLDRENIESYWDTLLPKISYLGSSGAARVKQALQISYLAHSGQLRKSGEPFIVHPVEVAKLLADLSMDVETVIAGLLHDTVEDTDLTFAQVEALFGEVVRSIVEGETKVSKLPKLNFDDIADEQAENLRQMFVAMTDDYRIIVVKLADRLHNMRTLQHMKPEKQIKISRETLDIFAPLAHRMGIWHVKSELEDISFQYLYPEEYNQLSEKMKQNHIQLHETLEKTQMILASTLERDPTLKEQDIMCKVYGRTKELYSIWYKMMSKTEESMDEITDVVALRVVLFPKSTDEDVDENSDRAKALCYHVLGLAQHLPGFQPVPTKVKDYISLPKPNGYQSLHTTLMLDGQTIEIQIRTAAMHQVAEYGMASHWFYKDNEKKKLNNRLGNSGDLYVTPWLSSIKEWQQDSISSREFVESVRRELLGKRVYVFLRNGKILNLARGATAVDAAFQIHTEVGLQMHGVHINGKPVPFSYELKNGDVVSIFSGEGKPVIEWMRYAKSRSTRSKLRTYFRNQQKESLKEAGTILLTEFLDRNCDLITELSYLNTPVQPTMEGIDFLLKTSNSTRFQNIDELLVEIGQRHQWSFLRGVCSKLFKVPLSSLVDAERDMNHARMKKIYDVVEKRRRVARNVAKAFGERLPNSNYAGSNHLFDNYMDSNSFARDRDELTDESIEKSKMTSPIFDGSNYFDGMFFTVEVANVNNLCPHCLPVLGDDILGTRPVINNQDDETMVHRTACPRAQRALNRMKAMKKNCSPNSETTSFGGTVNGNTGPGMIYFDQKPKANRMRIPFGSPSPAESRDSSFSQEEEIAVELQWPNLSGSKTEDGISSSFLVEIVVYAHDRKHLLADCGDVVSEISDIVKTASITKDEYATFEFLVKVKGTQHLQMLMDEIRKIDSIMSVERRFGTNLS